MEYAVNIADMTKEPVMANLLLGPHASDGIVQAEPGRVDGGAMRLTCDRDQMAAIIHVIRMRHGKAAFRFYESKTGRGGWKRIDQLPLPPLEGGQ